MADLNLYCDEELSGMIQDEDEVIPFVHDFGSQDVLADMTEAILLGEDYFDKLRSGGLIMQMRNAGLHYISEASRQFDLQPSTVMHGVNYLDRCLSTVDANGIHEEREYLFVSCLMVASKLVEVSPPRAYQWCKEFGLEIRALIRMEARLAILLEWRLNCSSPLLFLHHYLEKLGLPMKPNLIEKSTEIILYAIKDIQFLVLKPWEISLAIVISVCLDEVQREAIPDEVFQYADKKVAAVVE
ncbi:cyclin-D2-3 [Artemisia annua]|uniref:Cyclin-D2-3 n=1 Tax=Artemisia annua TaxID=35608 RepID=A0A2U1P811_ARTAN|nr:cyclin-D2-3 [Artemisia annua]